MSTICDGTHMATQPASIETLLGINAGRQTSRLMLAYSIEDGLPVAVLDRLTVS